MDERPPRQPDPSEPPENSADTDTEARPQNPYRIPQRPPESEHEETGGFSYQRPARKDEGPAPDAWDNPFRSGVATGDEDGPDTPWGAPVPGDVSPAGKGPAEPVASEESWDTGTPWGTPVPDEGPRTSAFGAVGAFDESPGSDDAGTGTTGEASDSGSAWASFDLPDEHHDPANIGGGRSDTDEFAFETRQEPDARDIRGTHASNGSLGSGADTGHDTSFAEDAEGAWGPGSGGHDVGAAWGMNAAAHGPGPAPEHDAPDAYDGADESHPSSWEAGAGAADAWGWSESSDTHDNAANTWGSESGGHDSWGMGAAGASHTWGTDVRDDRGADDMWGTSGSVHGTHEAWNTGHSHGEGGDAWGRPGPEDPGPSTAAFDSIGVPDADGHQYGAAHGDGWDAWADEDDQSRGSGQNAAWGAAAAGAAGAAAWGAPSYSESGDTEFYGDAHSGGQDWDDPYHGRPAYQGDTPYPGDPVQPPASEEGYEYLYGGAHGGGYDGYDADHGAAPDPDEKPRKSRKGLLIGAGSGVLVLALLGGAIGWYVWQMPEPEEATAAFASSWEDQDYEALAETTRGDDAAEILGGIDAGLGVDSIDVDVGQPSVESGEGSASYEVTVSLTNADDWGWEGELPLVREDGEWWVDFSPEVAYPGLGEGEVLARTAVWGERGHILAADGSRLDTPESSGSLQMIAGSLGEADEDDIERLGPAYDVGDTIGVDGLQRTHEEHLAGEAATTIVMADAEEARGEGSVEATEENTVATLDGSDGEDITTSIDPNVQSTAASAIMDADDPAGLVALRPSSGEILAAVNVPGGFNRAFEGQYPPGSAFKIVSYSALLDSGMSTDATMNCPEEYELGGWPFRNAGEAEYGSQSVTEAFATSCNTALVAELGDRVNGEQLLASAEQFGMNQPLDIGVTTNEPVFPAVDSATMLGSQGIGQGQVLTSPLHMATLPAAIADGSWRHPVLVNEPEPTDLPEPTPIANAEAIRPMMRAVTTDGTAKDLDFQGEVFVKTGTAEFGTAEDADEDDELPSHAWMVGYKGDIAFAVIVDGGGGGSSVAGPLAESFANGLP